MSKNNVRIAIRDSTDSHNVAFFDNKAGIKYKSANLQRFLAGSASILTIKYNSKDIDTIRSGCKLAFRYKNRDYWLNVMNFEKKGFEVELTAYSLGLELNNETRGEHKPANAMSIAEYVAYYDPEHALTIGVNEVSDKRIKLEWTGTDTILARLFSVANSFGAELDFSVELNDDYSLKRQVLNIYKKGNLGTNKVSQPVRVGKELKVINYSDNIKELRTAVRATGKDGLTIDGLNKKIYDSNKQLLYYSSGMTVYAPQSRDRFPSVGKGSNDNWIVEDLGETQYETKEALWGYMYGEIQKKSVPEITYEVEGAIEAGIGDTQTLIDDIHFEPPLYVQARVSELEDDILTGKVTKSTFINFERKYSQIADVLLKQVEALAEDAAPYIIRLSTNNGYIFKNGEGSSTITARLEKYSKDIAATWKWVVDNKVVGTGDKLTVKAEQVTNTMAVTVIAYVNGNEVVRDYMTFSNSDDGVGVESIDRYFTSSDQSDGVTIEGAAWSDKPPAPTEDGKYLWAYDEITYTDGTVTTTKPAAVGANFDVDAFRAEIAEDLKDVPNREEFENKIAEELATSKAEITTQIETAKTQAESNAKEYADTINQETAKVAELANAAADEIKADLVNVKDNLTSTSLVANNAQAAVDAAKQELAAVNTKVDSAKSELTQAKQDLIEVASDLNTAKQDLTNSVTAVNTKVDNAKAELTQTKQQLTTVADDLSQAKTDLQNAVSAVDTKATNLKSDLTQAKQDLNSQAQQLQAQANAQSELTKRVSSVEKTANGTKTTVSELSKTVAQNGKDITSVTARTKVVEDDLSGTKTTLSQVKTTADSTSQKTATLEAGLNGLTAKFDSLKVGGRNLLTKTNQGKTNWSWKISSGGTTAEDYNVDGVNAVKLTRTADASASWDYIQYQGLLRNLIEPGTEYTLSFDVKPSVDVTFWASLKRGDGGSKLTNEAAMNKATANKWTKVSCVLTTNTTLPDDLSQVVYLSGMPTASGNWLIIKNIKLEKGNIATDYSPNEADLEQKVAEYKQTADQNYASLSSTVQTLDGQVQSNKTTAEQTAAGFKTRIESLETYKDGESERANTYFESAKTETAKQLTAERTAIAKDYVAKSTYTSDVTGIRNDLSATTTTANTTKTNLANYQASNDKVVASLKSSLQTTDGNVSNLQTKVEAVPGQITSAVSAVEGKIPTNVSTRNLILKSNDFANPHKQSGANTTVTSTDGYFVVKSTGYTANAWGGISWNMSISEMKAGEQFSILMPVYIDSSIDLDNGWAFTIKNHSTNSAAYSYDIPTNKKDQWFNVAITFKASKDVVFDTYPFYVRLVKNGLVRIKPPMLVRGNLIPSDYQPAFEDTESDINAVSSELKQTADGMTLLATKTELNSAKTELQSGITTATSKADNAQSTANNNAQTISTHTTQISALNTGLSAKVSQSDFNTLSGRVTTAENNIIAKANELSSKITSVESKIPTEIGAKNLIIKSTAKTGVRLSANGEELQDQAHSLSDWIKIEPNTTYTLTTYEYVNEANMWYSLAWYSTNNANYSGFISRPTGTATAADLKGGRQYASPANAKYAKVSYPTKYAKVKFERGKVSTDYTSAPEDTANQISSLSSQIKQTADGMTLLATKTELNSAKSELQSGITTATNKANNNAQTISTHTTQISALNTGLQAKVSQTDFNTLSGRVTTAENNIIAKANELSSKITSVEGKIPTSVGGRNLLSKTNQGKTNWSWIISSGGATLEDFDTYGVNAVKMTRKSDAPVSWSYIQYSGLIRKLIEPDTKYTLSFDVYPTQNVTFTAKLMRGDAVGEYTDWAAMNTALANRWTKVFCVLTSKTTLPDDLSQVVYLQGMPTENWNWLVIKNIKLEKGVVPSDWSPAPEDASSQISSLSSEIKQTADGMTMLATKTELNSAKSDLQSGITTATNKANSAQSTADSAVTKANAAQSASNANAQIISTHTTQISALNTGLSAKVSQTDFNTLSGRVTTAENNITAKANELSSKITSVEGKIPTNIGTVNLIVKSTAQKGLRLAAGAGPLQDSKHELTDWIKVEPNKTYTLTTYEDVNEANMYYSMAWYSTNNADYSGWIDRPTGTASAANLKNGKQYRAPANAKYAKVSYPTKYAKVKFERGSLATDWSPAPEDTINQINSVSSEFKQTTDAIKASVQSLDNSTVKSSSLTINADGIVMKAGKSTTDVANAIGSYFSVNQNAINLFSDKINVKGNMIVSGAITSDKIASKSINTAHLNGKIITADVISSNAVTADAIKAGAVTTEKMSANSINGDRIAAGTLDAAKIKAGSITASQIASGTITSNQIKAGGISSANIAAGAITADKIAANSISSDKIVSSGITANVIQGGVLQSLNGSTNFELNTGKLFYNNNNTGVFRVQDGASTMGLKFSNTPVTVNGTSRILSRAILGGDRNETTLDDGKWDKGGFSGLVIETIKGAIPAVNEHADSLRAISDTIYFTHTYSADSPTGVSAHGWKMETYAPDSSISGNIVLKPYGINYRQSDIVVGDVRLDNGDGSGYWMRATINTLKACFGHILNGGVSSSALNAIRSELNKISGT